MHVCESTFRYRLAIKSNPFGCAFKHKALNLICFSSCNNGKASVSCETSTPHTSPLHLLSIYEHKCVHVPIELGRKMLPIISRHSGIL